MTTTVDEASHELPGTPLPDVVLVLEATDGEHLPVRRSRVRLLPNGTLFLVDDTYAVELKNGMQIYKGTAAHEVIAQARVLNGMKEPKSDIEHDLVNDVSAKTGKPVLAPTLAEALGLGNQRGHSGEDVVPTSPALDPNPLTPRPH